MPMTKTETKFANLKINRLTKAQYDSLATHAEDELWVITDLVNVIQYTTLPEAKALYDGDIVQYIGETTTDHTQGYFYRCVESSTTPGTYAWEQVNIQPAPDMSSKVDKVSTTDQVYATATVGGEVVQTTLTYAVEADPDTIVQRNSTGEVIVPEVTDSSSEQSAVSKKYVDENYIGYAAQIVDWNDEE